jgi:hypothetical protein
MKIGAKGRKEKREKGREEGIIIEKKAEIRKESKTERKANKKLKINKYKWVE